MEDLSAYELAQKRIERRRHNRNRTYLWLFLAVFFIPISFAAGGGCTVPLAILVVFFAAISSVEWYFASRSGSPSTEKVNQEAEWLFGEGWQNSAGVQEYLLALERIRKRRGWQMRFIFHLCLFMAANAIIISSMVNSGRDFFDPPSVFIIAFLAVWLGILVFHGIRVFPTQNRLGRREREAGEDIRREIEQMQPAKRKNKLKRDVYYVLNDDGELVEVDQESPDKPKRRLLDDHENS